MFWLEVFHFGLSCHGQTAYIFHWALSNATAERSFSALRGERGGGFRPFTLEKMISS